jgi:hypothetical protein
MRFPFSLAHTRIEEGGWTREVTRRELPIATTLAGVDMKLNPGAYREPHWHISENSTFMLSDFFAHTPKSVLAKNFGWTPARMASMPEKEKYIA